MLPFLARAGLGVLVAVVGFGLLFAQKDVALVIDGDVQHLTSHAATVGQLLERADVEVGEHDQLTPDAETELADGMLVELVRAREIMLLVGDTERRIIVTALTVDEVLEELGEGRGSADVVRPSRLTPVSSGMTVQVRTPVPVTVAVDGAHHEVITDAPSVIAVLDGLGVERGPHDQVTPAPESAPEAGTHITVQRVTITEEARQETIEFGVDERPTDALPRGQRREVRAGQHGVLELVEEVVRIDGVDQTRNRTAERVVREPEPAVVEIGTAARPRSPTPSPPAPSAPAPAPAPAPAVAPAAATAPAPTGNAQEGEASRYASYFAGRSTANGETYDPAALTAAHRTLPMGTRVRVTNLANGKTVTVRINDRGPFVQGRIIDLSQAAFSRIGAPGTGILDVRITW
ncbi:MAG: septal ring lytic transglycosylase RlpA family protein [Egibacteraceae bacterium]